MIPPLTALTLTPSGASSTAMYRAHASSAALADPRFA